MKLPNSTSAVVPREKIIDYLLSATHREGRGKAGFFAPFGFSADSWEVLAAALLRHAARHELAMIEPSPFGQRYVIDGELETPSGRSPTVRTVWFIETGDDRPRFVTAYPIRAKGRQDDK